MTYSSDELKAAVIQDKVPEAVDAATNADSAHAASHTSCYTNEAKRDKYESLTSVLQAKVADPQQRQLIVEVLSTCADIASALRTALVTVDGTSNSFGDTVLTVDLIADKLLFDWAAKSDIVHQAASEEKPEVITMNENGRFVLCWDPLDGSSIVDNNWAVGTIVGVWDRKTGLLGSRGRDQVMSLVVQYGPRATAIVTMDDGVYEFTLQGETAGCDWICSRENIVIAKDAKIFAPANLRASQDLPGYSELIDHWMKNRLTLRYTGGLVPDVYQQFTKKQGVFANPTSTKAPAKLRIAFEAAPFALLVEKAGGKTSDGKTGGSILDVVIEQVDQRTPLCIGSAVEVERFNKLVLGIAA